MKRSLAAAVLALIALGAIPAQADGWRRHSHVGVFVNVPGPYYAPYYYAPPPMVVYRAPPPMVVYGQPQVVYNQPPVDAYPASPVYTDGYGRQCREFQQTVTVGGVARPGFGTACLQPDGTWRIVP